MVIMYLLSDGRLVILNHLGTNSTKSSNPISSSFQCWTINKFLWIASNIFGIIVFYILEKIIYVIKETIFLRLSSFSFNIIIYTSIFLILVIISFYFCYEMRRTNYFTSNFYIFADNFHFFLFWHFIINFFSIKLRNKWSNLF